MEQNRPAPQRRQQPAQTSAAAAANDPANAPATTPKRNADHATLSERARLLNKSHAALNDVAEVRAEKVEAAKEFTKRNVSG